MPIAEARGRMRFLSSIYGKNVLSGHQASYTWATVGSELARIRSWTGETPAVRGTTSWTSYGPRRCG